MDGKGELYETRVLEAWSPSPSTCAVRLRRPEGFAFQPTHAVRLFLDGPEGETSRSMSIASGPERPYLDFAVRNSASEFKRAFLALRPGDPAWVRGPKGRFLLDPSRPAVMLAGGIGVTPFRCMLQALADSASAQQVLLVYANHDPTDVPFKDEFDALAAQALGVEVLYTVSTGGEVPGWSHRVGRVDPGLLRDAAARHRDAAWYIAGPPDFVRALVAWLLDLGIPKDDLHAEVFKGYAEAALTPGR